MSIHQVSVIYQPQEDRLLLRLRTHDAQLYELWLTRRLMSRLWAPLEKSILQLTLQGQAHAAMVMPEAHDMVLNSAQEKSRSEADFAQPFDDQEASRPLGERPLLVEAVDMGLGPDHHLNLRLRDAQQRQVNWQLPQSLAHNVHDLMQRALHQAEWGLELRAPAATSPAVPADRVLN